MTTIHAPADMPTLLAAHHLGDDPVVTDDGRVTTAHLGRASVTGGFDVPGEFDLPPAVPVQLVGDIPWELRDDADEPSDATA